MSTLCHLLQSLSLLLLSLSLLSLSLLSLSLLSAASHPLQEQEQEEETPVTRFQQYLRINTAHPTPDYSSAISFLRSQSHLLNLTSRVFHFSPSKPLLLLTWQGSDPSLPSLLLNSHLDSVPAEPHKWSHPPFSAFRHPSSGRIFARGAQDDKCIGLQYLEAVRVLQTHFNFTPTRTVYFSYVPDEEIGGVGGMMAFAKSDEFEALNLGFALDEGQASVGDEYRVFYADRSPWKLVVRAVGMPGHGSRMFDGGAMENLMRSMEVISRFRESQLDLVRAGLAGFPDVVSVNPVYLKAGIPSADGFVMNMQPSDAEAGFDVRLTPTTEPDTLKKKIADEWAPASRNMTFEITENGPLRDHLGRPLMTATDDSNPWWSVFKQAIEAAGGKLSKPEILPSTTDARFIRQRGIPTLGFSPMKNTPILLHEHDEFLKDTVYLEGINVYVSIIKSLSSFEGAASP